MTHEVLIVDDEADIRRVVADILRDEGYECRVAADADGALAALCERLPALMILDIWLEGGRQDGIELLDEVKRLHPDLPVVMISGHGTIETAVAAIKKGAYDFIEKPFEADRLLLLVDRAIANARLLRENAELRQRAGADLALIGVSNAIQQLRHTIGRVAPTDSRVLIVGPAGSGKELVARRLHEASRRAAGPFVVLNCATMAPDRMELELFGTDTGFDGPGSPRVVGTFEQAHGGTLLLDEVADMPIETQGKIVRVLQEQTFQRLNGGTTVGVNVRVVATTNRNLAEEMAAGRFRQDLYYRLNVVPISVPALAARREDIPPLVDHFLVRSAEGAGLPARRISVEGMAALQAYDWPGNVRQLRNTVDWLVIMAPGDPSEPIRPDALPPEIGAKTPPAIRLAGGAEVMGVPLREARELFERAYLIAQLGRFGGNISRTALFVGMERSALHRKLRSLGVATHPERFEVEQA